MPSILLDTWSHLQLRPRPVTNAQNATFANMLGGNNTMMQAKGEVPIFKPKPRTPHNQNATNAAQAPAPAPTQQA
jgi:hypothetical protein